MTPLEKLRAVLLPVINAPSDDDCRVAGNDNEVRYLNIERLWVSLIREHSTFDSVFDELREALEDAFDDNEKCDLVNALFDIGIVCADPPTDAVEPYGEELFRERMSTLLPGYAPDAHRAYVTERAQLSEREIETAPDEDREVELVYCRLALTQLARKFATPGLFIEHLPTADDWSHCWEGHAWEDTIEVLLPLEEEEEAEALETWACALGHPSLRAWLEDYFKGEAAHWTTVAKMHL